MKSPDPETTRILAKLPAPDRAYLSRHIETTVLAEPGFVALALIRMLAEVVTILTTTTAAGVLGPWPWWAGTTVGLWCVVAWLAVMMRRYAKARTLAVLRDGALEASRG